MALLLNSISTNINSFTFKNDLNNPDFSNGTTSWSSISSTNTVSNNVLTNTGSGGAVDPRFYQVPPTITYLSGKKIFMRCFAMVTNSICSSISFRMATSGMSTLTIGQISSPVQNTKYIMSGIATLGSGGTNGASLDFQIRHVYSSAANAAGKSLQIEQVMLIDLSSMYGAGNEPSAADCVNIFRFVVGTKQPNFSKQIAT